MAAGRRPVQLPARVVRCRLGRGAEEEIERMSAMIEASCHCGAIQMEIAEKPQRVTSCNCSICHRLGTLWAYYHPDQVTFTAGAGTTVPYAHGERSLAFHRCPTCGCVTHWASLREGYADRMP